MEKKIKDSAKVKTILNDFFAKNHDKRPVITTLQYRNLQKGFLDHVKVAGEDTSALSNANGIDYGNFSRILTENKFHQFVHPEIYSVFDLDGNGTISYFEFLLVLMSFKENVGDEGEGHHQCKALFEIFDKDESEFVSRDEFKDLVTHLLTDKLNEVTSEELDHIYDTIDIAHTEQISFVEFKTFYR